MAVLWLLVLAPGAHAEDLPQGVDATAGAAGAAVDDAFQAHFQRALEHYRAHRYDEAARELSAAYTIRPVPGILLNLGHVYLDQGLGDKALFYYGRYLREEPRLTAQARADIARYQEQARRLAAAPPAAPVTTPAQASPQPAAAARPRDRQAPAQPGLRNAGIGLVAAGAALLAGGALSGGLALGASRDVVATAEPFDLALDERGRALNTAALCLDVLGGVTLAAGGVVLLAWGVRHR